MMISVIGGSGFIGTNLVRTLLSQGQQVKIVDKQKSGAYPDLWVQADVRDVESLRQALMGSEVIYNLAAEHRDDVTPVSLYDEVNVDGARNICTVADELGIKKIIFTSSVAVYGFTEKDTDESGEFKPFNDYGRTKLEAEKVYLDWVESSRDKSLTVIRPTVVFGIQNRGNVYNLLRQMASGKFLMIGSGSNRKSMAYVENVAAFLAHALSFGPGIHTYNYSDKPDYDMNALVSLVNRQLGRADTVGIRFPYWLGFLGGLAFDAVAAVTGKKLPISSIRVKKFCASTEYSSAHISSTGFQAPVSLEDGLKKTIQKEFVEASGA